MKHRQLGRCGLKVSELALGGGSFGQGRLDERGVREAMAAAFDAGVNYLPTLARALTDKERNARVARLVPIARELECSLAHLALAWCTLNPLVSTVITGASRPGQVTDNIRALDLVPRLMPEVCERIASAIGDYSQSWVGASPWHDE